VNFADFSEKYACFMSEIRDAHCHRHIETIFLYVSAPILRGAKTAALISLQPHCLQAWRERENALRKATGLRTLEIKNQHGAVLLLIYDAAALSGILEDTLALALLIQYGYPAGCDPGTALERLRERFLQEGFPHEVGLFLGYPPKDVWGFILNEGRNCVCCRYWKVYHNVEQAQEQFRRIDEAQNYAMDVLMQPTPVHVAAKLLKAV
jgi:hypothetical protein